MTPNTPAANQTWFDFTIDSDEPTLRRLSVYAFSGTETVGAPYEFSIELVSRDSNLDLTGMLGREGLLTITDKSGRERLVHGVIRQTEQLHTANAYTHYRCELVPRLWFLSRTRDHKIYQRQSVPQIIRAVLNKHIFLAQAYSFKLRETYPEREYVVQYAESDMDFVLRLCEEEGIFVYFEHSADMHCMCFSDAEGGPLIPGENSIRFYPGSGQTADTAVISCLKLRHRINSDGSTYREWNFTTPALDLTSKEEEPDWRKAPVPQAMRLETYQFPHLYQERKAGDRYARIQLQRQLTFRQWIECESDVSRYLPGFTFSLHSHPRADANRNWWIVSVRHEGEQPGVLEHEAPDRGQKYKTKFTAIPDDTRFVPEQIHRKVRVDGLQSAIVTGPSGEEAFVDEFGRVKVQFHWDRLGNHDGGTTCWVRVADTWAGANFGFIQVPRIGQEVMVEFMEGDPDRPVITGRVYNTDNMPPWKLPEQKTLSGIQSREFRGSQRNQLVLDDTQGQIQAQLSSDHGLSQLNLGYLTRVNHLEGRKDFRGEGFELRTDDWGVVRAAKGLYISTDARNDAAGKQKDLDEADRVIQAAARQHGEQARIAASRNAQEEEDATSPADALQRQWQDISGNGENTELAAPHLVLSSPAGIALATPQTVHIAGSKHVAVTAGGDASIAASRSLFATALKKIGLFAQQMGIRVFAAKGKVEIQAQSDDLDIIAEKQVRLVSVNKNGEVGAKDELLLHAGGSYIRLDRNGVTIGTGGAFTVHAASHEFVGPDTLNKPLDLKLPEWPQGTLKLDHRYHDDDPIRNAEFEAVLSDGSVRKGRLDAMGNAELEDIPPGPVSVRFGPDARSYTPAERKPNPKYRESSGNAASDAIASGRAASERRGGK